MPVVVTRVLFRRLPGGRRRVCRGQPVLSREETGICLLLVEFIQRSSAILKELLESVASLVTLGALETVLAQGTCLVCATDLKGDVTHCAKCNTPHHRECWEYFNGCSLFACGAGDSG